MNIYYKDMTITIQLPYCTVNNTKYYLDINTSTIAFPSISKPNYSIDDTEKTSLGIVKITLQNPYFGLGDIIRFELGPLNDELLDISQNDFIFSGGTVNCVGNAKNGKTNISLYSKSIYNITYQKEEKEDVQANSHSYGVTITNRPSDAVSVLGGGALYNQGTGDSCAKHVLYEFDIDNTNYIKVTTLNIMPDVAAEYMDITYTLVDDTRTRVYLDSSGMRVDSTHPNAIGSWTYSLKNQHYNTTAKANFTITFSRQDLDANHKQYFFKTIEYDISIIKAGVKLYSTGGDRFDYTCGRIYGYVDDTVANGTTARSKMTVTSSDTTYATINKTITTTLQTSSSSAYGIYSSNMKLNKTSIEAGESIIATGTISAHSYPYGNAWWLTNIILGVVLPEGVSINEDSVVIKKQNGEQITGVTILNKATSDGNILWTIRLPDGFAIGKGSETLGNISNGNAVTFSLQLDTSYMMNNTTLYARDMFYLAGDKQTNNWGWSCQNDTYDLNNNGMTTDKIGRVESSNTVQCQINSKTANMDLTDSISIEHLGQTNTASNEQTISSSDDIINYSLQISCTDGGQSTDFEFYVPIPKTSSVADNFLISSDTSKFFETALQSQVLTSGDDLFNIYYAFDSSKTYEMAKEIQNWYTEEQIQTQNLSYSDVTYLKLTLKQSAIENGNSQKITLKLKYAGDGYLQDAGMTNTWKSRRYFSHVSGQRQTAGNFPTDGVSIKLTYSQTLPDITLSASKDMTPKNDGNVNSYTQQSSIFPVFKNSQTFSITNVELYNVVLQTKEYVMQNATTMVALDANKTFAITTSMGSEVNVLSSANTTPIIVGTSSSNTAPEFTFKLYNADLLTDNSQTRYIIITLKSDNGVTLKQKININREITKAQDPKSAIVAGKMYLPFDDTIASANISANSSASAQFVVTYVPAVYNQHTFELTKAFPIGTMLTLCNLTNTPTYYYLNLQTLKTSINLNEFIQMGTTNVNYIVPTTDEQIDEKIILIIDFSNVEEQNQVNDSYEIQMKITGATSEVEDFMTSFLDIITKSNRDFTLTVPSNISFDENFNISYEMTSSTGAESIYEGRKLSLVLELPQDMPEDTYLISDGNTYYLNSNKAFIVSGEDMQTLSKTYTLKLCSNMQENISKTYSIGVKLYVGATANGQAPLLGDLVQEKQMSLVVEPSTTASVKITSSNRLLRRENLSQVLELNVETKIASNCTATIELQQKVGSGYQKLTDKLSQVNGVTTHTSGVFELALQNGQNDVNVKLASSTSAGTYRFMVRIYDSYGNQILQVPYNIILID